MKSFPNTLEAIRDETLISGVSNILHAEWNMNRYIQAPDIEVDHFLPGGAAGEEVRLESEQIEKKFPIESVVKQHRGTLSSYVIDGTRYRNPPRYENQRARSEHSWNNQTTWLWYGDDSPYEYWTTSLKAGPAGNIPYGTGLINYVWSQAVPVNKIRISFQRDNAFPLSWRIYIDVNGDQNWFEVASNTTVPSDGILDLYRVTTGNPFIEGLWGTVANRMTDASDNHVMCYGIRLEIEQIDVGNGRPAIVELSPRLEVDLSDDLISWSTSEELADQEFITPIGSASANTGSVSLSNSTGKFNEHDRDGLFYRMLDEEVEFRGFLKFEDETIPMFTMLSDSWAIKNLDTAEVSLVDPARPLQNMKCKDMLVSDVTVGTGLHMMFAGLGLAQFEINETKAKQTPRLEQFYTKEEDTVWEFIQNICKGLQVSMFFDATGKLRMVTKESAFNQSAQVDYNFTAEETGNKKSDVFDLTKDSSTRFNKVIVRYNAINNFSLSGSQNQKMWTASDPTVIGAAQVVKNVAAGDTAFWIDPNRPEALPGYSGTVVFEGLSGEVDYEGKQFYCKHSSDAIKYITVKKPNEYWEAVEKNLGQAPRFTGRISLKEGQSFNKNYYPKNYSFNEEWDTIEHQADSPDGIRVNTGGKHSAADGSLKIATKYSGGKRLNVSKKQKNWNRFDRVGVKVKINSNDGKSGVVIWPQGKNGASGYYFAVDPMSDKEIQRVIKAGEKESDSTSAPPPKIHGYVIRDNGSRKDMDFDAAKDFKDIPPLRVGRWSFLEVAIYEIQGGYEFEVFVNGQYCKTFVDTSIKLNRNEKAGMTFTGVSDFLVDKFYVVNYPGSIRKGADSEKAGFLVRRKDLWNDRKSSRGDGPFNNYLKSMEKYKKTRVFESDFSGRFHGLAREKLKQNVRFEHPALSADMVVTNNSVSIVRFDPSSWGARFTLVNKSERPQLIKGSRRTRVSGADRTMSCYIYGKSFRRGEDQEVEYKKDKLIDRIGELLIEFESEWIQDRDTANDIAKWVTDRFGDNAEIYTIDVFGNPLIEIADVVTVEWPDKGLIGTGFWCVTGIERGWSDGLTTSLKIRRII